MKAIDQEQKAAAIVEKLELEVIDSLRNSEPEMEYLVMYRMHFNIGEVNDSKNNLSSDLTFVYECLILLHRVSFVSVVLV